NGVILLTDFGLARVLGSAVDEDSEDCFGTPAYMCPEQIMRQVTDQRSDIYSLGASLYHMMTCEFLFLTDTIAELIRAHLDEAFPYKRAENSGLPPGWIHLLEKMTRKKPEERYQTYVELREALDNVDRLAPVQINTTDDTSVLDNPDRLPIPTQAGSRENIHGLLGDRYASWSQTGLEDGISRSKDEVMDKISKPGMQVNELVPALRELNQDDVLEMSDLASAVAMIPEVDEFISALARSEFVSCSTVIETRRQAIRQVSLELSRKILLTHMMIKEFSKKEKEFSWQPYWQYCIATGVIAHFIHKMLMSEYLPGKGNIETKSKRTITGALRRHSLNKADIILFSAALTHGIGKLILAEIAAYPYYSVLSKAIENQDLLSNEEQKVFSCDHHEAGEKWLQVHRFDSQMRQAATNYNSLETYDGIVPGLVAVASHVVRIYGIGYGGDPVIQTRDIWNTPVWENLAAQCKTIELTPDYMEQELIPLVGTIPTYQY
ncbi:MAG: HDOD domain-containing protein, partial [Verrucomicrobiota bacterium]